MVNDAASLVEQLQVDGAIASPSAVQTLPRTLGSYVLERSRTDTFERFGEFEHRM